MATKSEQKLSNCLKIVEKKKEGNFALIQSIFELAKTANDPDNSKVFLYRSNNIDNLQTTFLNCIDEINSINADILGDEFAPCFQGVDTMYEMVGYIKMKQILLKDQVAASAVISKVHLPQLDFKSFSGDFLEWPLWYESFKTLIHNNRDLSDLQKVQYLVSKLTGNALAVCSGILPTSENYSLILETLVKKYDDKRTLAMSYLNKLLHYKQIKLESTYSLNTFIDNFSSSVAALKNLRIANLDDFIILAIALSKLDQDTVKHFEMSVKGIEIPTFSQLDIFLKDQAKMLSHITKNSSARSEVQASSSSKSSHKSVVNKLSHSFVVEGLKDGSSCPACHKTQHPLFSCSSFLQLSPVQRFELVKENKYCLNCLNPNHIATACVSKHTCSHCSQRHNSLLHFRGKEVKPTPPKKTDSQPARDSSNSKTTLCSTSQYIDINNTVLLSTVKVKVFDKDGNTHLLRLLLDSGSMSCFLTKSCVSLLGLTVKDIEASVQGIGSTNKAVSGIASFSFCSRYDSNMCFSATALIVDHVTNQLPTSKISWKYLQHLQDLLLADDSFSEPNEIDGILGASVWPHIVESGRIVGEPNCPIGLRTKLGIVVMGSIPASSLALENNHTFCSFSDSSLESIVHRLWDLEQVPKCASPYNEEEQHCEDFFLNTYSRDLSGRFTVALPFKGEPSLLGDSYMIAKKRLLSLEGKFEKYPELRIGYNQYMQDYIDSGHMSYSNDSTGVFIPHHAVVKVSSSTPVRPVFDASCATSNMKSLNDLLFSGPNIYSDLFLVLLNFRIFKIGLSADIRKMFRQIFVRAEDREYQKILWRFNPEDPIAAYTLNTVTFGLKPSPWLALRTVKQLSIEEADRYKLAASIVNRDIYMDDIATSISDEEEAKELYYDLVRFFSSGGFELVKWSSSSTDLLSIIPESDKLHSNIEWEDSFSKILGMQWNAKEDVFCFKIEESIDSVCSKRSILSVTARIWDILGLLTPVIIKIKILLQTLWSLHIDWDSTPPFHIIKAWNEIRLELPSLTQLRISRHLGVLDNRMPVTLIGFSDASEKAYACCIYVRIVKPNGERVVNFVCGKSKVAPLKTISIPRLELCGALLLANVMRQVINTFEQRCNISNILCLSDSTVALNWINSSPSRWTTFVANRVTKIQETVDKHCWFHCKGDENPSDCATRGLTPSELLDDSCLWYTGPSWLYTPEVSWSLSTVERLNSPPEEKKAVLSSFKDKENYFSPIFARFSSWGRLVNTFVYVLRFLKLLPHKDSRITSSDIQQAELSIFKLVQQKHFSGIFEGLQKDKDYPSTFKKLNLFIHQGLLRVGGRLSNSSLGFEQKFPLLLPQREHVVHLLVEYLHKENLHTGSTLLLALLRNNYWVLGARMLTRKVVHSCNVCFRNKPVSQEPFMGNLPDYRVQPAIKAFIHTGLDIGGPFNITMSRYRGAKVQKAYLCLFLCMTTKAVHLELVSDLSTQAFVAALKRFLARRGPCLFLYSDNAKNFVGARNHLNEVYKFLLSSPYRTAMQDELNHRRIQWKFSPPLSPHMAGAWESQIKSSKAHLYKAIGTQILSYEELNTVLTQIESLLNSRPLCQMSADDASEPVALTPAHFLTFQPLTHLPSRDFVSERSNRLTRYELLDQLVQTFWKRWSTEYLTTLQVRNKWINQTPPISVGTVCIIKQDLYSSPLTWPLGKVVSVFPGSDGVIRVAEVKTKQGCFKRPVVKLCPLPTQ